VEALMMRLGFVWGLVLVVMTVVGGCGGGSQGDGEVTVGGIHQEPTAAGHSFDGESEGGSGGPAADQGGESHVASGDEGNFRPGYELCDIHQVVGLMYSTYAVEPGEEVACEPDPLEAPDVAVANWWFPGIPNSALNHGGMGRISVGVLTDKTPYVPSYWEQQKAFVQSQPETVEVAEVRPDGHEALWIDGYELVTRIEGRYDAEVTIYPDLDDQVIPDGQAVAGEIAELVTAAAFR
jgi:hypothetical protein